MLWRFSPLPAGFWDGASGTHIWPSAGFSKPTITNVELERTEYYHMKQTIKCAAWISGRFVPKIIFNLPGINSVHARSGRLNKLKTYAKQQQKTKYQTRSSFDSGRRQPQPQN
jgi:hypothetical protein